MNDFWAQLITSCVSAFTDAGFLQAVGGLLAVLVASCIKQVRTHIVKKCKDLARRLTTSQDKFNSHISIKYHEVNSEIAILRAELDAARVSIYQFHNGDRFTLSDPIFKVTCSHENVSHGLVPDSSYIKYVLVSTGMSFIAPLLDKTATVTGASELYTDENIRVVKYRISDMPYDAYRFVMERLGTATVYATILYSHDRKNPLGIMAVQYIHEPEAVSDKLVLDNINRIKAKMCQIEFCLDEDII